MMLIIMVHFQAVIGLLCLWGFFLLSESFPTRVEGLPQLWGRYYGRIECSLALLDEKSANDLFFSSFLVTGCCLCGSLISDDVEK